MTNVVSQIEFDGAKLKAARGKRSRTEVAEVVGVTRQALWQIETGVTKPAADILLRLCSVLNIQVSELSK